MNTVFLCLGGNMGDREFYLNSAINLINQSPNSLVSKSSIYETESWGKTGLPNYLNQCIKINTTKEPFELMHDLLKIEQLLGRTRTEEDRYTSRTIDIDMLFYNDSIINSPELILPHPRLRERRFVLMPLADIAKDYQHPLYHQTIEQLLNSCSDSLLVQTL